MYEEKSFLKLFFTISIIVFGVLLLFYGFISGFLDREKIELYDELIIFGIIIAISLLIGFGLTMLERKLKPKNNKDNDENLERVLAQSDGVLEKLDEDIWEDYK